jgi:subtilisin family serine protease
MLKTVLFRFFSGLCLIAVLAANFLWSAPVLAGDADPALSRVSSLLALRVQQKIQRLEQVSRLPSIEAQNETSNSTIDITSAGGASDLYSEQVFLRFASRPTADQLSDLLALGITPYPDSWVPPVGDFRTGFILAEMPVDRLPALAAKDYILNIDTAEQRSFPQNDVARTSMDVGQVWSGGNSGAGVTIAVLDSGIDASNADFPALDSNNSKDYSAFPALDDTIRNTVTGHGSHVTGSALGRGVNSAQYKGVAPAANLVFLKIGCDNNSSATYAAEVGAIMAAVDIYHADIITMSYGGWSQYHDGTNPPCQAVDYAVWRGVTVFMSAGNEAIDARHYSGTVAAHSSTDFIRVDVKGAGDNDTALFFNLVWFDGLFTSNQLSLQYYDSTFTPLGDIQTDGQSESPRGTESYYSYYDYYLPSGDSTFYLKVQNASPNPQFFHIYDDWGSGAVTFTDPDPFYTLGSPAEADGAIAVGAYVTRTEWVNYLGTPETNINPQTLGAIATFSSRGPRVDNRGSAKPEIVAPGSRIISVRDNDIYPWSPAYNSDADIYPYEKYIVDNDGVYGSGPADYLVMHGTSMAAPLAAGVAALILSAHPNYTPARVRFVLQKTAVDKGASGFDYIYGAGLINAEAAVNYQLPPPRGVGGQIEAIDKAGVELPWLALLSLITGVSVLVVIRPRHHLQ